MAQAETMKGKKEADKDYKTLEFETTVVVKGNSGGIYLPKALVGKYVRVHIEVLD